MLEECGEACGWTATIIACLSMGSFAVPMKSEASDRVNVDPLVFQSYKTFMFFVTCWSVLLLGAKLTFTPWGILSGFLWVPGGTAGIYAVRTAGLAVSQGTWSSVIVMVGMVWGICVFHEGVRSVTGAFSAALLLCIGLCGMSYYSSPKTVEEPEQIVMSKLAARIQGYDSMETTAEPDLLCGSAHDLTDDAEEESPVHRTAADRLSSKAPDRLPSSADYETSSKAHGRLSSISICGFRPTMYQLGLAGAVFNGLWSGTMLVPLHYAGPDTKGLQYTISFACGAMMITIFLWMLRFLYHFHRTSSARAAINSLPSFHIGEMWKSGCTAGALFSLGSMSGILAVTGLGLGVGQSVVHASLLISGLWGIFWYKEVTGRKQIFLWLLSASLTVLGTVWLGYEHERLPVASPDAA